MKSLHWLLAGFFLFVLAATAVGQSNPALTAYLQAVASQLALSLLPPQLAAALDMVSTAPTGAPSPRESVMLRAFPLESLRFPGDDRLPPSA